jgi:dolichol-phosphate mannosyltransferase
MLRELNESDKRINYISLSRNFGHQAALKAALDRASGDCVISLDADMQHPPEILPVLVDKWQEGFDIVYTVRQDGKIVPKIFYALMNRLAEVKITPGTADFRLLDRVVVDVLKNFNEPAPFMRGLIPWVGFKQRAVSYEPGERLTGKSKYSLSQMLAFAVSGITSFSIKPLRTTIYLGLLISFAAFLYALYALYIRFFTDQAVTGWTSVIISVLFIGGVQLVMLGIIGQYLGMLFLESKRRPSYIIMETSLSRT